MNEFICIIFILPASILLLKLIRRINVKPKKEETHSSEISQIEALEEYFQLPESTTIPERRKILKLALVKNYDREYQNSLLFKRYAQLAKEQIISKDMVDEVVEEKHNILMVRYMIESECTFCNFSNMDTEARQLTKIYIHNLVDVPIARNLTHLVYDPDKLDYIRELYVRFKEGNLY